MSDRTRTPPHVEHVRQHLERLATGMNLTASPAEVFLGPDDETHFWEVVGFRMRGVPTLVLGAIRFQRQELPGRDHGRESLGAYLSSPPPPFVTAHGAARAGEISTFLPRWSESIPAFLRRLRGGVDTDAVHLSPELIEVAFDLRMENPGAYESGKRRAGPLVPHAIRTADGHVLYGLARAQASDPDDFVALTQVQQFTPSGKIRLPSVMVNRDYISAMVTLSDQRTRLAAAHWAPFLPATASERHILLI
ncbi:MAG: hypothetical protein P8188_09185 [Gemmatimonadota bacterium]|jgi:hypothetical protein